MKITVVTLFPQMIEAFVGESIVKRAVDKKLVEIEIVNLRDFAIDAYGSVDDRPYGGGAGMVLRVDVAAQALQKILNFKFSILKKEKNNNEKVVMTSARGKLYSQQMAQGYAKLDHLVILAGHYEGFDERVGELVDEEVSVGDFVMTGGEIPAASIIDSVVRLIPGVLKKDDATTGESFFVVGVDEVLEAVGSDKMLEMLVERGIKTVQLLEYPQYTRPEEYAGLKVPEIVTQGNHAAIRRWQLQMAYEVTKARRPDLLMD